MRIVLAVTFSVGVTAVMAASAPAATRASPTPSEAAIAQYVEAVPSATGPVPVGTPASAGRVATLAPTVRAKVESEAGADAPVLIHIAEDPRFGARPVAHSSSGSTRSNPGSTRSNPGSTRAKPGSTQSNPGSAGHGQPAQPKSGQTPTAPAAGRQRPSVAPRPPDPIAAAFSTAGSSGLLIGFLLVMITATAVALRVGRRPPTA
jgi:hypothetical protein